MRKFLWASFSVLFLIIGVPNADADSYVDGTINFTVTGGNVAAAPTGSFVYDKTTNLFVSFLIFWDVSPGIAFPLQGCANGTGADPDSVIVCDSTSDGKTSYEALTSCNAGAPQTCRWGAAVQPQEDTGDAGFFMTSGPWSVSEFHLDASPEFGSNAGGTFAVSTPEPNIFELMLLGIGFFLALMPIRLVRNLPRLSND